MTKSIVAIALFSLINFISYAQVDVDWAKVKMKNDSSETTYLYKVQTKTGSILIGEILSLNSTTLILITKDLGKLELPVSSITSIVSFDKNRNTKSGKRKMVGVNHYLIAPSTPYGLDKGEINLQDSEIFLISAWYGISDHFTLGAGMSLIPGLPLSEQLFYLVPKFSFKLAEKITASVQYAQLVTPEAGSASLLSFSMGLGRSDNHISLGYSTPLMVDGDNVAFEAALINIGGVLRTGNKFALLLDFNIPAQSSEFGLFGFGARYIGESSSFDFGFLTFNLDAEDGILLPWFNYTIRF